jgi:F420-dependent oxidoreductase-like protein
VRFSFWPMGMPNWNELLAVCRQAEAAGWDGLWYADHFMPARGDLSAPVVEAWTTLTALAALIPRVRVGTLVSGNTYRQPAIVAKMAAQADIVSGGRFVLGLGAGWQENEHKAYGVPFYTLGERLRRLEEACQVIRGLLREERTSFAGRYYQIEDAPLEPKPVQRPLPLLIGGGGEKVTLRIAARYADEWNTWGTPETLRHKISVLDRHCAEVGRDPKTIRRSAQAVFVFEEDLAAVEDARAKGRMSPGFPVIAGSVDELRRVVTEYAEAGVGELVVPDLGFGHGEHKRQQLDRFIAEVAHVAR